MIRGEINSSDSLSRVSLGADLAFRALILAVDDYGRFDGRLPILRGALFPLREEVTSDVLAGWLGELEREGCVTFYEAAGRRYLYLPSWERHRGKGKRSCASKYPDPAEGAVVASPGIPGDPRGSADVRGDPRGSENPPGILGYDVGRGTRDEGRGTGGPGGGSPPAAPEPPAEPDPGLGLASSAVAKQPKFDQVDLDLADLVRPSLEPSHPWHPAKPWASSRHRLARWSYLLRTQDQVSPDRIRVVFAAWGRLPFKVREWPERNPAKFGRNSSWEGLERAAKGAGLARGTAPVSAAHKHDGLERAL